jgi:hypothetical protein
MSGRTIKCSVIQAKCNFFPAFSVILGRVGKFASEEVILSLLRSTCVPCLLYSIEAFPVYSRDRQSIEFTVTRTFMKIFQTGSPAVVKDCQYFCKFLPVTYQTDLRTARFMQQFVALENMFCSRFSTSAVKYLNHRMHGSAMTYYG